jgi:hypothetical protein
MALKKNLSLQYLGKQIDVENCYLKIVKVEGSKESVLLVVNAKTQAGEFVWERGFAFDPLTKESNIFASGYLHLKTLPEFAGAADC